MVQNVRLIPCHQNHRNEHGSPTSWCSASSVWLHLAGSSGSPCRANLCTHIPAIIYGALPPWYYLRVKHLLQRIGQYLAWFAIMIGSLSCLVVPLIYGFSYGELWGLPFLIVGTPPLIYLTFTLGDKWDIKLPQLD